MNFRYRLAQFMAGRYGIDAMFYVLLAAAVTLAAINCFLRSIPVQLLVYALEAYALFRVLSRNLQARSKENRAVSKFVNGIRGKIAQKRAQRADGEHIYKKCPNCRAILRLPYRKGKHKTVCPKCNFEFNVNVR